jgi:anti-sigma regulatory factor (Ser/Thr protein kinase)
MSTAPSKASGDTHATLTVPRRIASVRPATAFLVRAAQARQVPTVASPLFEVAVSEAVTNAIRHGGGGDDQTVTCDLEVVERRVTLRILTGSAQFSLPEATTPDIASIEFLRENGYGLPIIRSVFPSVRVVEWNGRFGVELSLTF